MFVLGKNASGDVTVNAKGVTFGRTADASFTVAPLDVPTIASDLADYPPGGTVTLTGDGWDGDTAVNISVNDTYGETWHRVVDVDVWTARSILHTAQLVRF